MKNKLKLLTSVATLFVATNIFAADEGSIGLTLNVGNGNTTPVDVSFTPEGGVEGNAASVTLETLEANGVRTLSSSIGALKLSAPAVNTGAVCSIHITSANPIVGSGQSSRFTLVNINDNSDIIKYFLQTVNIKLNNALRSNNEIKPSTTDVNNPLSVTSIANGSGLNKCDIEANLIIYSDDNLTSKNGVFEDTLTYTMSVI